MAAISQDPEDVPSRCLRVPMLTRMISFALLLLVVACAPPKPPPLPPLVVLTPYEGTVLTLEAFRVPEGVTWAEIESDCAKGVGRPGDIALLD